MKLVGAPHLAWGEDGELAMDGVRLREIAEAHDTPTFVYSIASVEAAYRELDDALAFAPRRNVAYAVKANASLALLTHLARLGSGADIVSGGELVRALRAGVPPGRIVYSGVGKRDEEYVAALDAGVRVHLESAEEIPILEELVARRGRGPAAVALRVNPDVDAETHPYIATGLTDSKFGVDLAKARELLPRLLRSGSLVLECVACHIGSQLPTPAPLEEAATRLAAFARECLSAGAPLRAIDVGGGFPIPYGDEETPFAPTADYAEAIRRGLSAGGLAPDALELIVEPGRSLVGNAGVLLTRVLFLKVRGAKRFVMVDAAMTELIRPALYDAYHEVVPVRRPAEGAPFAPADVVGPVCETGDFFALDRPLPPLARGDLVVLASAGAYGMTMSSRYNARPRAAEVVVEGGAARLARARETLDDLLAGETP